MKPESRWFCLIDIGSLTERSIHKLPEQFKNKQNIKVFMEAITDELQELIAVFEELETLRSLDTAVGVNLDRVGDIVVLTRAQTSGLINDINFDIIDDERYRIFLKYKALRNSNMCTFPELEAVCELLYDAKLLYFNEFDDYPAHFKVRVGAQFDETMLSLLKNSKMTIKPGGVSVELEFFDLEYFGFGDINREALGFGVGKFIHIIGEEDGFE